MALNKLSGIRHFKAKEFECRCGCGLGVNEMQPTTLRILGAARELAGTPFNITSAIRCKEHNANEGGSKKSSHLTGYAIDIEVKNNRARYKIKHALKQAGFKRIGDSKSGQFIHTDNDPGKPQDVEWLY